MRLGINKGDHDVSCSTGGRQPLVVVCEATGVHHGPTKTSVHNTAVVTNKSGTTSLVCVERGGGEKRGMWSMGTSAVVHAHTLYTHHSCSPCSRHSVC